MPTEEGGPEGEVIGNDDHDKEHVEGAREPEIVSFPWKQEKCARMC